MDAMAFDIETIADREALELLPAVEPRKNLKDPEKIKQDIAEKEKQRIESLGLNPLTNLICCFAYCNEMGSGTLLLSDFNNDESSLLMAIWDVLKKDRLFATFNGNEFDVPILNLHSLRRRIRPAVDIDTRRYHITNHYDLRAILTGWNTNAKGSFDFFLKYLFGPGAGKPEEMDGSMVQHLWDMEMYTDIAEYAKSDAENTYKMYKLIKRYFL